VQKLVNKGNNNQQQNAQYLQALVKQESLPVKSDDKQPGNNTPLLIGGLVLFGVVAVMIGYLLGKRKNNYE
jgi:hypothetical protein